MKVIKIATSCITLLLGSMILAGLAIQYDYILVHYK